MLQLNDISAIINRFTNIPPANGNLTACMRVEIPFAVPINPNYVTIWTETSSIDNTYAGIFSEPSSLAYKVHVSPVGGPDFSTGPLNLLPITNQFFVAYRRNGTTHIFTVDGINQSLIKDISTNNFNELLLGNDGFSVVSQPIRFRAYKEWAAFLSDVELAQESGFLDTVVRVENLTAFTPLKYNLLDVSGNNNHWIGSGNFTFTESPGFFPFVSGGGLVPNAFTLNGSESLQFNSVPVGSGYSIQELTPSGWSTEYQVSNGSSPNNISVGDGEVVIINVINRVPANLFSGIYKIVKGKRQDTLWLENFIGTRNVKIP